MQGHEAIETVFNQQNLMLGFFGALGGAVRSAVLRIGLTETARVVFVGSATAFSSGTLAPVIVTPYIGDVSSYMGGSLGAMCAAAFLTGLIAVAYVERLIDRQQGRG